MRRSAFFIAALLLFPLAGCAVTGPRSYVFQRSQEKKLAQAVTLLEKRDTGGAAELLGAVAAEPGVPGVTDEALFRLGLLHLTERGGAARGRQDLERLKKEFPGSSWTPLAAILTATLTDEQGAIRRLKESNASLTRENRELRQSIERLKNLELELGKGKR